MAQRQRIASSYYAQLQQQAVTLPPAIHTLFKNEQRRITLSNLRLYANLHHLASLFRQAEIPFILLKGSHLARTVYPSIAPRAIGDIDLLLRQEQLEQAVQCLIADGYRSFSDHLPEVQSDATVMRHLTGLVKEGSPMVELHWHIAKQHPPNYDVDELWQRAQTVTINAIRYLTLAPEDLLLHLCVHASYQHQFAFDLRSLWDIRQVCKTYPDLGWNAIFERTHRWRAERGVFASLHLAAEMIAAAIPTWVLQRTSLGEAQDRILAAAQQQLLTGDSQQISLNRQVTRLYAASGLFRRMQILWERLLPSRAFMAREYPVRADSPLVYAYYPLRILHVLRKHGASFWQVQTQDPPFMPTIERAALLWNWLMEEGEAP